jgi:hypothetical protein
MAVPWLSPTTDADITYLLLYRRILRFLLESDPADASATAAMEDTSRQAFSLAQPRQHLDDQRGSKPKVMPDITTDSWELRRSRFGKSSSLARTSRLPDVVPQRKTVRRTTKERRSHHVGDPAPTAHRPSAAAAATVVLHGGVERPLTEGNPRFRLNVFPRVAATSDSVAAAAATQEFRAAGRLLRSIARSLEDEKDDLSWMIRTSSAAAPATTETRAAAAETRAAATETRAAAAETRAAAAKTRAAAVCLADAVVKAAIAAEGHHVGFLVAALGLAAWRLLTKK